MRCFWLLCKRVSLEHLLEERELNCCNCFFSLINKKRKMQEKNTLEKVTVCASWVVWLLFFFATSKLLALRVGRHDTLLSWNGFILFFCLRASHYNHTHQVSMVWITQHFPEAQQAPNSNGAAKAGRCVTVNARSVRAARQVVANVRHYRGL
jgi:hypothetical protein